MCVFFVYTYCVQNTAILQVLTGRPIWFVGVLRKAYMHEVQVIGTVRQVFFKLYKNISFNIIDLFSDNI